MSNLVLALAATALAAIITFGAAFWLALRRSQELEDPEEARVHPV